MRDLSPALDHVVALIPIRGLEGAKARLGEALDAEERRALVERLLASTVAAALETPGIVAVAVVLVVAELFSQRSLRLKINAGLVLIPLILRALMIG